MPFRPRLTIDRENTEKCRGSPCIPFITRNSFNFRRRNSVSVLVGVVDGVGGDDEKRGTHVAVVWRRTKIWGGRQVSLIHLPVL